MQPSLGCIFISIRVDTNQDIAQQGIILFNWDLIVREL